MPAGAVLLALGAIAGAAQLAGPGVAGSGPRHRAPQQVAVTSAVRACPPRRGQRPGHGRLHRRAPPRLRSPASGRPGHSAQASRPGRPSSRRCRSAGAALRAAAPISQTEPGVLRTLTIPAAQSVAKKAATVPAGLVGDRDRHHGAGHGGRGDDRLRPGQRPLRRARFGPVVRGPGQQNGAAQIQLDLMNVDALAASVNVTLVTDAGPVQAGNDTGITVPPRQTVTESLSSLAAGSSVAAIRGADQHRPGGRGRLGEHRRGRDRRAGCPPPRRRRRSC